MAIVLLGGRNMQTALATFFAATDPMKFALRNTHVPEILISGGVSALAGDMVRRRKVCVVTCDVTRVSKPLQVAPKQCLLDIRSLRRTEL